MEFFIPYSKDRKQAEDVWNSCRIWTNRNCGAVQLDRIFSIEYVHEGKRWFAEVGQPEPRTGELVIAILNGITYLVCTPNRGVIRGTPILVGITKRRESSRSQRMVECFFDRRFVERLAYSR